MHSMKILQWNLENFFIDLPKNQEIDVSKIDENSWTNFGTSSLHKNKPVYKLLEMAKILKQQNPDVCVFQEVVGKDSLENFNALFLDNQYEVYMASSNSYRGIDIAFMVKKVYFDSVEIKSNHKFKLKSKVKEKAKFCRDIPELHLTKNQKSIAILGVHLKSKRSSEEDFFGIETRAAEVEGILKIYSRLRKKKTPVILAGDFNGFLQKNNCEYEFEGLLKANLLDYLEHIEGADRTSFVRLEPYTLSQLDYILIEPELTELIKKEESGFIRFTGFYDIPLEYPTTPKEKWSLPSDHYPQVLSINYF